MPARKEPFDISSVLEGPDPLSPLSLEERVQQRPIRPFLNVAYLASQLSNAQLHQDPISGPSITFPCPICMGEARVHSGFSPEGAFKITCTPRCDLYKLRAQVEAIAPAAFHLRDDLLYPFPPELASRVIEGIPNGFVKGADKGAAAVFRRFRGLGDDVSIFEYKGPDGRTLMIAARRTVDGKKRLVPVHLSVDASDIPHIECSYPPRPLPPYGWDQLVSRPDAEVLVVEGEKTAMTVAERLPDYVVVTSAMGAENAAFTDWAPLHGRRVTIWPDNDIAGLGYAQSVAAHAFAVRAASVRIVALPNGLPDKWDLADELPENVTWADVEQCLANAVEARWDDVKTSLRRHDAPRRQPPFRLPDGHFAGDKVMVKAIGEALEQIDPGCKLLPWRGYLGAVYHALGEAGLEIADDWSKRDAAIHGKYVPGEVREIFDAFAASPPRNPLPVIGLFRAAMKQSRAGSGNKWEPEPAALASAQIAEFESRHRKVKQGDNVLIAVQETKPNGTYSIRLHSEKSATSIYLSQKASNFSGEKTNLFSLWANHQRIPPLDLVFKPGGKIEPGELNSFLGLEIEPRPGGYYTLFREHIYAVMASNGDEDGYLWKVMAYRLQNLDAFVPALLAFIGPEGSGKTTITGVIAKLLAPYSIVLSDPEKFVGRNNAELEGKLFVQLEEMILGRREEYDSRLKHYITSETLDVEEKYKSQWQVRNRLFVSMTANKREALRVTEHSRRWAVYQVEDRYDGDQEKRATFFGQMMAELESGGYEALAFDLMRTDLTGFSPARVPKTKLFEELVGVAADRDLVRAWWREKLESGIVAEAEGSGRAWTDPVRKDALFGNYRAYCEANDPRAKATILPLAEWAKQWGRMLPGGLDGRRQMHNGKREQMYVLPPYEECCSHFERLFGCKIERAPTPGQERPVF